MPKPLTPIGLIGTGTEAVFGSNFSRDFMRASAGADEINLLYTDLRKAEITPLVASVAGLLDLFLRLHPQERVTVASKHHRNPGHRTYTLWIAIRHDTKGRFRSFMAGYNTGYSHRRPKSN